MRVTLLMVFTLIYMHQLFAADNNYTYQFNTQNQQMQFYRVTHELRCLVCQNETLADSNAPLAKDLRQKIALQIIAGASDKGILNYLINRYGDFILYKPRSDVYNISLMVFSSRIIIIRNFCVVAYFPGNTN